MPGLLILGLVSWAGKSYFSYYNKNAQIAELEVEIEKLRKLKITAENSEDRLSRIEKLQKKAQEFQNDEAGIIGFFGAIIKKIGEILI